VSSSYFLFVFRVLVYRGRRGFFSFFSSFFFAVFWRAAPFSLGACVTKDGIADADYLKMFLWRNFLSFVDLHVCEMLIVCLSSITFRQTGPGRFDGFFLGTWMTFSQ
jgi:hypothetical protein